MRLLLRGAKRRYILRTPCHRQLYTTEGEKKKKRGINCSFNRIRIRWVWNVLLRTPDCILPVWAGNLQTPIPQGYCLVSRTIPKGQPCGKRGIWLVWKIGSRRSGKVRSRSTLYREGDARIPLSLLAGFLWRQAVNNASRATLKTSSNQILLSAGAVADVTLCMTNRY